MLRCSVEVDPLDFDLFEFHRFLLSTAVCTYGIARFIQFIWRWQGLDRHSSDGSAIALRYLVVLLLRLKVRRFAFDFFQIAGLITIFVLLILSH